MAVGVFVEPDRLARASRDWSDEGDGVCLIVYGVDLGNIASTPYCNPIGLRSGPAGLEETGVVDEQSGAGTRIAGVDSG